MSETIIFPLCTEVIIDSSYWHTVPFPFIHCSGRCWNNFRPPFCTLGTQGFCLRVPSLFLCFLLNWKTPRSRNDSSLHSLVSVCVCRPHLCLELLDFRFSFPMSLRHIPRNYFIEHPGSNYVLSVWRLQPPSHFCQHETIDSKPSSLLLWHFF